MRKDNITPKVSVIIPTYNRAHYLKSAVESVLSQEYSDLELIVVDDGSTDGTKALLEGYGDRLIYSRQERKERSAARNKGVSLAKGEYVAFLDSDDVWFSDKLKRQVPILDDAPRNVVLVHGHKQTVDDGLKPLSVREDKPLRSGSSGARKRETYEVYLRSHRIFTSTILIRRSELLEAGGYDTAINGREDLDLYLRLLLLGCEFAFCSGPPLIKYRLDEHKDDRSALDKSYVQVYEKHLGLCPRLKDADKIARAQNLLYQNLAQTYYRLGDLRRAHLFWNKALNNPWMALSNIHFWKQELKYGMARLGGKMGIRHAQS